LELDENANIISYEEYYPYGDTSYQAGRSTSEVSQKRYRYTGKEKDEESGLYYYGARYYSTMIGIFISVDPKIEKYPNVSSYAYCLNNPVKHIDPDGKEIRLIGTPEEQGIIFDNLKELTNDKLNMRSNDDGTSTVIIEKIGGENKGKYLKTGSELIRELNKKGDGAKTVSIKIGTEGSWAQVTGYDDLNAENKRGTDATIEFDTEIVDVPVENRKTGEPSTIALPNKIKLGHELIHAYNVFNGIRKSGFDFNYYRTANGLRSEYIKKEELSTMGLSGHEKNKFTERKIWKEQEEKNWRVGYGAINTYRGPRRD